MMFNIFIVFMFLLFSLKLNKLVLFVMCFVEVDLGMTTTSRCTFYFSIICVGVILYFFVNLMRILFLNNFFFCVKGEYVVIVNFFDCEYLINESLFYSGCDSIWLYVGWIFVLGLLYNVVSCVLLKLFILMCCINLFVMYCLSLF